MYRRWTKELCIEALDHYIRENNAVPKTRDIIGNNALADPNTFRKHVGQTYPRQNERSRTERMHRGNERRSGLRHKYDVNRKEIYMETEKQFYDYFGTDGRRFSKKEKEYIDKWFNVCKYDFTMVKKAYMTTITNIGKVSFAFTDRLLSHWQENGENA